MTLRAADTAIIAGATPTSYTPATSDTISGNDVIPGGGACLRCVTTGTAATLTIVDPNKTIMSSSATNPTVSLPSSGTRVVLIPVAAVDPSTNLATYTLSTTTGISCELYKF